MAVYNINGEVIGIDTVPKELNLDYDACVKGINHRGYNLVAPENTLPAYILSKKNGFNYVETDVAFTSDGVAVLLHDSTIDRTSNGSGSINQMTYEQVRQYDFGSWKSADYAGTKIPSLDEFLTLCKSIMLHPYIELKTGTKAQIEQVVDMVNNHGLKGLVTYISYGATYLSYVKEKDSTARLGLIKDTPSLNDIQAIQALKTSDNIVFLDTGAVGSLTNTIAQGYADVDIPIEAWTIDSESTIIGMNKYINGVTSNSLVAGEVLYNSVMT